MTEGDCDHMCCVCSCSLMEELINLVNGVVVRCSVSLLNE